MIGKIAALFFVLFIVGCCGFSVINSKSFLELQLGAEEKCITNYSLYSKESSKLLKTSPSELVCPLQCLLSELGLVNEGGLNKILVNWTRKLFELEEKESISGGLLQELAIFQNRDSEGFNTRLDAIFHIIRTINNQLETSCSETDKANRNQQIISSLNEIQAAVYSKPSDNQGVYIPSAKNSRYLELAQDAGQKCMSNFNVTVLSIIRDFKSKSINKKNICTFYCLHSELRFFDNNGLNQIWVDKYQKVYKAIGRLDRFEAVMELSNRVLPILNSYCSSSDHEVSDSEFEQSIQKIWMEIKKLRSEQEIEDD